MLDFGNIIELAKLLEAIPPSAIADEGEDGGKRKLPNTDDATASYLLEGLLQGNSHSPSWQSEFNSYCGKSEQSGLAVSSGQNDDDVLLNELIAASSDEVLNSLIRKYGRDSTIGARILEFWNGPSQPEEEESIEELIKKPNESFYQLLAKHIDEKGFKSDADFYNSINFSRQLFSRLRNPEYILRKRNVYWLTAGLKLDYDDTKKLLAAQGYCFSKASRLDTIVSYVIKKPYDLDVLNETLIYFDEKPIGCE